MCAWTKDEPPGQPTDGGTAPVLAELPGARPESALARWLAALPGSSLALAEIADLVVWPQIQDETERRLLRGMARELAGIAGASVAVHLECGQEPPAGRPALRPAEQAWLDCIVRARPAVDAAILLAAAAQVGRPVPRAKEFYPAVMWHDFLAALGEPAAGPAAGRIDPLSPRAILEALRRSAGAADARALQTLRREARALEPGFGVSRPWPERGRLPPIIGPLLALGDAWLGAVAAVHDRLWPALDKAGRRSLRRAAGWYGRSLAVLEALEAGGWLCAALAYLSHLADGVRAAAGQGLEAEVVDVAVHDLALVVQGGVLWPVDAEREGRARSACRSDAERKRIERGRARCLPWWTTVPCGWASLEVEAALEEIARYCHDGDAAPVEAGRGADR